MGEYTVQDAIRLFLNKSKLRQGMQALQIERVWEEIMGKTIASYTDKIQVFQHTLYVHTQVAPLKNELMYQKDTIIKRVNEALGDNLIKEVVIR